MNKKEIFEAMEAKEKKMQNGKSWTLPDVVISHNEELDVWFLRIGRVEGRGKTAADAMLNLHKNVNDPNHEPIPF